MTRTERNTMNRIRTRSLAALMGIVVLATACSDSKQISGSGSTTPASTADSGSTTTSSVAESTTTSVAPETTLAPTTVPATAPPATPAPTVAPPPPPPGLSPLGSTTNLHYTPSGAVTLPDDFVCDGTDPGIPGWTMQDCQYQPSYQNGLTTLVARRNDDSSFGVFVLFHDGGYLTSLYEAYEPGPGTWDSVTVVVGDFHFDDGAEVWVGYRYAGTGHYLDLDVLDPLPDHIFLRGLQGLDHGQVDVHPGGATVQTAVYGPSDPNCCPSQFKVQEISFAVATNDWRINAGTDYPADSTPPITSDF